MKKEFIVIVILSLVFAFSCKDDDSKADAYGNFEAVETLISAEASGKLLEFNLSEGDELVADAYIGYIDTVLLYHQKEQAQSKIKAIESNFQSVITQVAVIDEQITTLEKEKNRVESLLEGKAATQKQLDDIVGQLNVLERQKESVKSKNASLFAEIDAVNSSIALLDEQIYRAIIENPVEGTVLEKYVEQFEIVGAGKPLYKIANLDEMILRAYFSGDQLDDIKIGQKVKVEIDKSQDENHEYEGTIVWIATEAEFTPKVIQTKEERVNLVYAVKINVVNDGKIKIGMPGEVRL